MAGRRCNYAVRTRVKIRIRCIYHAVWRGGVEEARREGGGDEMEVCALCGKRARMYCESDQAKLCWDCDDKVHGANFLVAKHTRVLLCRACQSFTPWKASGPKLTPTHSLCNHCAADSHKNQQFLHDPYHHHHDLRDGPDREEEEEEDGGDSSSDADSGYEDDDEEGEAEEEEEEGENQVVPWSCASASESSPPLASSASAGCSGLARKRLRASSFVDSDDEIGCSSSETPSGTQLADDDSSSWSILRPWKHPRTTRQSE